MYFWIYICIALVFGLIATFVVTEKDFDEDALADIGFTPTTGMKIVGVTVCGLLWPWSLVSMVLRRG